MNNLSVGVIGTSKKDDERRVPIHPEHLPRLTEELRRQLIFETGYGERFGTSDSELAALITHLPTFVAGPEGWQKNETIRRAINIDKGVIKKSDILAFQNRQLNYPHAVV